jgi:hypothetical protein
MTDAAVDFWTDETSVLLTSFWGWSPETWGTVGWSGDPGLTHRTKLLEELTDPFITVCYATNTQQNDHPELRGKITGFYLMSRETGHRNEFTHPIHHRRNPEKWQHSLRALRAFSYVPEHRIVFREFDPGLLARARAVASWGEVLTNRRLIARLRNTPWVEVDVYSAKAHVADREDDLLGKGFVKAGPQNKGGYVVSPAARDLKCQLYVLRLEGDTAAYLGRDCDECSIFKIGLSVSPELRRDTFHKAMPWGAFRWEVERASQIHGGGCAFCFDAAVAGEDAMKQHLTVHAEHLGGEFYLATEAVIDKAWRLGHVAAKAFGRKN